MTSEKELGYFGFCRLLPEIGCYWTGTVIAQSLLPYFIDWRGKYELALCDSRLILWRCERVGWWGLKMLP